MYCPIKYNIFLSNAENLADVFDAGNDLIRLNGISQEEFETIIRIVRREDTVTLISLPYIDDDGPEDA